MVEIQLAYPLPSKTSKECSSEMGFPIFGLPSMLFSDNGKSLLTMQLIKEIVGSWQGAAQLVSGRHATPNRKAYNKHTTP